MIKLDYKNTSPLHEQIANGIKELIVCGALRKDEQLPSVRELSLGLTVNPNTVQRAYKTLETEGIIYSVRGKGNFVATKHEAKGNIIESLYGALLDSTRQLAFYGEEKADLISVIDKVFEEREDVK